MNQTLLRRIETNDQTLRVLHLRSERELRQFVNVVQDKSNIRTLGIRDTVLAPGIATGLFSTILPSLPFLCNFEIINCDCSNAGVLSTLVSELASADSLQCLCLNSCHIETRGVEIIVASLSDNTNLEGLILSNNAIDNEGAIALASLLSSTSSISFVNLSNNIIRADGISALTASVCGNPSVKNLVLHGNIDEPITHFKRVLFNDTSIESVVASNHTLTHTSPQTADLKSLLELNACGPEIAVRSKIIRFLNEQPTFVLTTGMEVNVMPFYMGKIGRDCRLNTMFEFIRNVPGLFKGRSSRP